MGVAGREIVMIACKDGYAFLNSCPLVCVCVCRYVDVIEQAVVTGEPVLIENLEETIDPIIDPLLGRHTIKKGR